MLEHTNFSGYSKLDLTILMITYTTVYWPYCDTYEFVFLFVSSVLIIIDYSILRKIYKEI